MPWPPWRCLRRIAEWRGRHQPACVHRIERNVAADRGIDGGAQLRLVVDSAHAHAAGEVHQRFLFRQAAEHLHGGFQRRQLAIRIENIELAVVLGERRTGIGFAVVAGVAVGHAHVSHVQMLDHFEKTVAIVREVLQDRQICLIRHNGHQVGCGDLRCQEFRRRLLRAHLIGHRHTRLVEEQDQQPPILVLDLARLGRGRDRRDDGGFQRRCRSHGWRGGLRGRWSWSGQYRILQTLVFEYADLLRFAVFGDGEIGGLEALQRIAVLVLGRDIHHHQVGCHLKGNVRSLSKARLILRAWGLLRRRGQLGDQKNR